MKATKFELLNILEDVKVECVFMYVASIFDYVEVKKESAISIIAEMPWGLDNPQINYRMSICKTKVFID